MDYTTTLSRNRTISSSLSLNPTPYLKVENTSPLPWKSYPDNQATFDKDCYQDKTLVTDNFSNYYFKCLDFMKVVDYGVIGLQSVAMQVVASQELAFQTITEVSANMISNFLQGFDYYLFSTIFSVEKWYSLKTFLKANPIIKEKLVEARAAINSIFGESTDLVLSVKSDPELGDYLLCSVKSIDDNLDELIDKMNQFDKTWLFNNT